MEGLVRFAVVNILPELHFIAAPHSRPWLSWLRLEVRFEAVRLRRDPSPHMIDDILRLIGLVDVPPDP